MSDKTIKVKLKLKKDDCNLDLFTPEVIGYFVENGYTVSKTDKKIVIEKKELEQSKSVLEKVVNATNSIANTLGVLSGDFVNSIDAFDKVFDNIKTKMSNITDEEVRQLEEDGYTVNRTKNGITIKRTTR